MIAKVAKPDIDAVNFLAPRDLGPDFGVGGVTNFPGGG
jgi:hypothetical protein